MRPNPCRRKTGRQAWKNLFVNQIVAGYAEEGMGDAEASANMVADEWGGRQYLALKTDAWNRLIAFYNAMN